MESDRDGPRRRFRWAGLFMLFACGTALADEARPEDGAGPADYIQAWLGAQNTDDRLTLDPPAPEEDLVGGLGTLPFGGGAAQRLWGRGAFRYGYEGGGLVSWKNHDTQFFAASGSNGGTLVVSTENTFFSLGVFMGAVASLQLTEHLRMQLAAGPSLTWARLDPEHGSDSTTAANDTGNDVSLVPYGRLGVEVVLNNGFMVGISVRYADDEFDFGDNGTLRTDEVLWLLTLGSPL